MAALKINHAFRQMFLLLALWIAISLLTATGIYTYNAINERMLASWQTLLALHLIAWLPWFFLFPLLKRLAPRYPIWHATGITWRHLATHLLLGLLLGTAILFYQTMVDAAFGPGVLFSTLFFKSFSTRIVLSLHFQVIVYLLIVALVELRRGRDKVGDVEDISLERLVIKTHNKINIIAVANIHWIEADDIYVKVHTNDGYYLMREPLKSLEAKLDVSRFVRIHRSAIVNVDLIKELKPYYKGDYQVFLTDGTELRLTRSRKDKLAATLGSSF